MAYPESLITARLAYGIDDFYIYNPQLQSRSLEGPLDLDTVNRITEYLKRWDKDNAIPDSAITTFPQNMRVVDAYYDPVTHTSGLALENTNTGEVTVGYSGTNFGTEPKEDFRTDGAQIASMTGEQLEPALNFYSRVSHGARRVSVPSGHSLGANLAALVVSFKRLPKGYAMNPAPIFVDKLPRDILHTITHFPIVRNILDVGTFLTGYGEAYQGFKEGLNAPYNTEFADLVKQVVRNGDDNMIYIASSQDVLSKSVLTYNNFTKSKTDSFSGNFIELKNAGWHLLPDLFKRENIDRVMKAEKRGREWSWNSNGDIIDVNGEVVIAAKKDFELLSKDEKTVQGLIKYSVENDLRSLFKKLDRLHDERLLLINDGGLAGSKKIYANLMGVKIVTQGIIGILDTQLSVLEKSYKKQRDVIKGMWNDGVANIYKNGSLLSQDEITAIMNQVPLRYEGVVVECLESLWAQRIQIIGKISSLTEITKQIDADIRFLFDTENELSQSIQLL